jgi:integrase
MKPKTLQTLMGHKDISITMNLYVHTSDEAKKNEVEKVAQTLKVV